MKSKIAIVFLVVVLASSLIAFADTITTPVRFLLPTTISFTLSVPGNNATSFSSGQTTTTIRFNSTITNTIKLNATPAGGAQQTAAIPIFNYTNTGNTYLNITVNFSTALPAGVTVRAGWADGAYQSSCTASVIPSTTACVNVTAGGNVAVANLSTTGGAGGSFRDVWLWADYNSTVAVGTDSTVNLVHTSVTG